MRFTAGPAPQGIGGDQLISVIWNKLFELEDGLYFMHLDRMHVVPIRPQDGQLAYADGTDWNPGSGRGVYMYDEVLVGWRFLG